MATRVMTTALAETMALEARLKEIYPEAGKETIGLINMNMKDAT